MASVSVRVIATLLTAFWLSALALAQAACTTGVVGELARYAQYDAIQIDCTRSYPQYNQGTTVTSTKAVTSGKTTTTSTRTVTGVRVTSSAPVVTVTVRVITYTATTSTARSTTTITTTATTTTTTATVTETTTTTVTVDVKRALRFRRDALGDLDVPVLVKRSKEEEFQASLKAQGASSSAIYRTFCSCYETKGATTTTTVTVPSTTTTTTTTTTIPTTTVTSTTTTTGTTTTTPVTTSTITQTATPTSTATTTVTTTSTSTVTQALCTNECQYKYKVHCNSYYRGFDYSYSNRLGEVSDYKACASACASQTFDYRGFFYTKEYSYCSCIVTASEGAEYALNYGAISGVAVAECGG